MANLESCQKSNNSAYKNWGHHGPPLISVYFVPLDGITVDNVTRLSEDFYQNFASSQWEPYKVDIEKHAVTPPQCLNDSKSRFRATKVIKWLNEKYNYIWSGPTDKNNPVAYYLIGVTDQDISTSAHNREDYGILGLSYLGKGNVSIISTHRLKRRKDLWKLAVHEFCHGFYGCPHCKNDDPSCIMSDAKGGNPHFELKDSLCLDCANICLIGD